MSVRFISLAFYAIGLVCCIAVLFFGYTELANTAMFAVVLGAITDIKASLIEGFTVTMKVSNKDSKED